MGTLADRIAEEFVAKRGFLAGAVSEARPLASACDRILIKRSGMHLFIVCIVDAESAESKRFALGREAAKEVLATCCERYGGTPGGSSLLAILLLIEVRPAPSDEDRRRLHQYSNRFFDQNAIHAFLVDSLSSNVVTATRFSSVAAWGWRRFLREVTASR